MSADWHIAQGEPVTLTSRQWAAWIVATALYIVISYPYQAVVYRWLGPFPQLVYAILCILGGAALILSRHAPIAVEYKRSTVFAVCVLVCSMLVTLLIHSNLTVIRDLLLLGLLVILMLRARGAATIKVVRALVYISTIALVPAMLVVAMFNVGLIDWPTWRVERLGLASTNPLLIRAIHADAEYYLPLWSALVPYNPPLNQGFGLEFVRQPFVYIEPTGTWLYTAGLFWIVVADSRMAARGFCLAVLGLALAMSFSVAGVLATAAAIMFCLAISIGGRSLVFALAGLALLVPAIVPIPQLLSVIAPDKAETFAFFSENLTVLNNLTLFGNSPSEEDEPLSYGFLVVLDRYGLIGTAVILGIVLGIGLICFRLLRDTSTLGWRRFPIFIGCFVSLAMLMKYPGIVPAMPAICLAAGLSFRQMGRDPFSQSLPR